MNQSISTILSLLLISTNVLASNIQGDEIQGMKLSAVSPASKIQQDNTELSVSVIDDISTEDFNRLRQLVINANTSLVKFKLDSSLPPASRSTV